MTTTNALILKQGSTLPILKFQLLDDDGFADLTASTVKIVVVSATDGTTLFGPSGCTLSDTPTDGVVMYTLETNDLSTPGEYRAEFHVTYSNGVKKYPSNGYFPITVTRAL